MKALKNFFSGLRERFDRRSLSILVVIVFLITLPLVVLLALQAQNLRQRAGQSDVVRFTDVNGVPLSQTVTDPNIYLYITLPSDWKVEEQSSKTPFVQQTYAQSSCVQQRREGCTGGDVYCWCLGCHDQGSGCAFKNFSSGGSNWSCVSSSPQCPSGVSQYASRDCSTALNCQSPPTNTPVPTRTPTPIPQQQPTPTRTPIPAIVQPTNPPPESICQALLENIGNWRSCTRESLKNTLFTLPQLTRDSLPNDALIIYQNSEMLQLFSKKRLSQLSPANLDSFDNGNLFAIANASGKDLKTFFSGFSCDRVVQFTREVQNQIGLCGASFETPSSPSETARIVRQITIENKDTDGSSGGNMPRIITSGFTDYINKPISWKLNGLKEGQTEAVRTVQITLSDGTTNVPFTTSITYKPRTTLTSASAPDLNEDDNPPPLIISDNAAAELFLDEVGTTLGYDITINESEDEIDIEFVPAEEFTEEAAREFLNKSDDQEHIYYLRSIMWFLVDTLGKVPGPSIDPWYAFCDHLRQDILDKVGAEPTEFMDGTRLACSDLPLTDEDKDKLFFNDRHRQFVYRKISARTLVYMIETAKLERENRGFLENAADFAVSLIPLFGPMLTASAEADPGEVSRDGLISVVMEVAGGKVAQVGFKVGGKIVGNLSTRVKPHLVIPNYKGSLAYYFSHADEVAFAKKALQGRERLRVKLVGQNGFVMGVRGVKPYLTRIAIRLVGKSFPEHVYQKLFNDIDTLYAKLPPEILDSIPSKEVFKARVEQMRKNTFALSDDSSDAILGEKLFGEHIYEKDTARNIIVVRESRMDTKTVIHEFIHELQEELGKGNKAPADWGINYANLDAWKGLKEGSVDWIIETKLGYPSTYTDEVTQINRMVAELEARGHDGTGLALRHFMEGDVWGFMTKFEELTNIVEARNWLGDITKQKLAAGLIPPVVFWLPPSQEEENNQTIVECLNKSVADDPSCQEADLNGDGVVDIYDYNKYVESN